MPLLPIKNVSVINNSYVPTSYILGKFSLPKSAKLFSLSKNDILAKFKNDPYVKDITLKRHFPSSLVLDMQIREPFYKATIDGVFYVFDEEGKVLNTNPAINIPTEKCFKLLYVSSLNDIVKIMTELKVVKAQLIALNNADVGYINCCDLNAIQVSY